MRCFGATIRRWLAGLVLGGALTTLGAAAADHPEPLDHVTLQLKWKHQFQFAGYYAAIAQGYYRDAGLDVTLREATPGRDPTQAVLEDKAEFGVGNSDLLIFRQKGFPVVVLASIFQHSPLALVVRAQSGVTDLQGLHDRKMMMLPSESAELFAYFKFEGIDPAKLKVLPHSLNIEDFISGKVDAMSEYVTDEPFVLRQRGVEFLTFIPRAGGIDFYGDNLFTTEEQISAHPARVRAFLQASLKGWDYALAHPEEIVDLILRDYNTQNKSREQLLFEAAQTAQLMHPGLIEVGHMNPGRWRNMADTYAEFGMLPRDFPLKGFLYNPNPAPDYTLLYWTLVVLSAGSVATLGWALPLFRLNRRLRVEVRERERAEGQALASEKQYRELAEAAPFPVTISETESSHLLFANRRADFLLQLSAHAQAGGADFNYFEDLRDREKILAHLRAGRPVTDFEVRLRTRDGRRLWVLLSAGLVEFAGKPGVLVAFQEITQLRALQDELQRAKEAAEALSESKGRYLAVMTHEVRSPLGGVVGLVNLMQQDSLSREQKDTLALIEKTSRSLLDLIANILDNSKLETGRTELSVALVELRPFVGELQRLFSASAQANNLSLTVNFEPGTPAAILTDPMRLRQILSNLLSNAIKFTESGGIEIRVAAQVVPTDPPAAKRWRVQFHVRDTGIGMTLDAVRKLFVPYAQANASIAQRFRGTGLGLAISSQLAKLLGGTITVQSHVSRGSTFVVEILADEGQFPA